MEDILFGLDVGTTKICAIVGEVRDSQVQIIGLGIAPSLGMRKGVVADVSEASVAVAKAVEAAEESSGYHLTRALVSLAGSHIDSTNSQGAVAIKRNGSGVGPQDIDRALEAAEAIPLSHSRQIVHMIPRNYKIDNQPDVRSPLGMHGFRMEVEAHIVTADEAAVRNLVGCANNVGIEVEELVMNALASSEAVLEANEREMGVIVADIGGGTTDVALFKQGAVWHTEVFPVGGYHVTNDIAIGLRAPYEVAEQVKRRFGDCRPKQIDPEYMFTVEPFGGERIQVSRQDLAHVIEARVEEIFQIILQDIKESGYDGLLPAGIVLTGGTSLLRGITDVAERVLNVPARVAQPKELVGLVDALRSPAYATSVGLLHWAIAGHNLYRPQVRGHSWIGNVWDIFRRALPE